MAQQIIAEIHEVTLQGLQQERASYVTRLKSVLDSGLSQEVDAYIANINRVNAAMISLAHEYRATTIN